MSFWRIFLRVFTLLAICGAAYLVYRGISRYAWEDIRTSITAIPLARLAGALGFAACSYLCLSGFDYTALHYVKKPLPYPRVLLASFCSLSLGHNIGVAALSSGAVRYRFYSRWGLSAVDVGKIIVFCGVTVGLGLVGLAGVAMLLSSTGGMQLQGFTLPASRGFGAFLVLLVLAYPCLAAFLPGSMKLWRWQVELPGPRLALAQIVIGTMNFGFVAACLHQLLSGVSDVAYVEVAKAYAIANLAALVSHVPGGVGVLEATIFLILPEAATIGALIAFRIVYFLVPLSIGLPLLGGTELRNLFRRDSVSAEPS